MIVLYVAHDHLDPDELCPGSLLCREVVKKLDAEIVVQNCDLLRSEKNLPEWLNGTPILARDDGSLPLRGREALQHLRLMLREQERVGSSSAAKSVPTEGRRPKRGTGETQRRPDGDDLQTRVRSASLVASDAAKPVSAARHEAKSFAFDEQEDEGPLDTLANGSVGANAPIGTGKISDEDLQRYVNARNQSPASANPEAQVVS